MKYLSLLVVAVLALSLNGCALFHKGKRSSARFTSGDSPNVQYYDKPETAGGAFGNHTYH